MATNNAFTTALKFWKYFKLQKTITQAGTEEAEEVGTGNNSKTTFFLDNIGVIESTFTISKGANADNLTALTDVTDFALDLETSKLTLTGQGVTSVGNDKIFATYSFCTIQICNEETLRALNYAEGKILRRTEQTFADSTVADPGYRKTVDELFEGRFHPQGKTYDLTYGPIVDLDTTVNGAFTLGGTTLTLTSGDGFPDAGTINIGGNKVAYTARSTNDLTVPNTTPTIADGARVTGEVIETSKEPEGNTPSYTVLNREIDYKIDFIQNRVEPLDNAFFGELSSTDIRFQGNFLTRATYFNAWHEERQNPTIPQDIEEATNMIAARRLIGRTVSSAHTKGLNEFNPDQINIDQDEIDEILEFYKELNVGTSPFNKQSIS